MPMLSARKHLTGSLDSCYFKSEKTLRHFNAGCCLLVTSFNLLLTELALSSCLQLKLVLLYAFNIVGQTKSLVSIVLTFNF